MDKKSVALLLLGLFLTSCAGTKIVGPVTDSNYFNNKLGGLASAITKNSSRAVRRVAVMDFVNPGGKTSQLGRYVTDKFSALAVSKRLFQIPSKGQIMQAVKQEKVRYNGTLNREASKKLGDALKVDAVIVGTISDLQKGSDLDLVVKMIDAKSGFVISAANASFYRSKSVSSMYDTF